MALQGGQYPFGTMATYSCGTTAAIVGGSVTRTCGGDGSSTLGSFDGIEPMCEGTCVSVCIAVQVVRLTVVVNLQTLCVLISLILPTEE